MKLVLAVIHDEDSNRLTSVLSEKGFGATKLATTGGFLKHGNTTIMIGVEDERVDEVLDVIKAECKTKKQMTLDNHGAISTGRIPYPVEVVVGGATIFVLDVDQFLKI